MRLRRGLGLGLVSTVTVVASLMASPPASATPVCAGLTYSAPPPCPRVFQEPYLSTNWTQFGPDALGRSEYYDGTRALQDMYPNYVKIIKLSDALHDPWMVSIGADGLPPWDAKDSKDGLPLYVTEVTDFRVPDDKKAFVVITEVHSAEPCGREAAVRVPEDLARWATDGATSIDNGNGPDGKKKTIKVVDLLKQEKIFFLMNSPDGWRSGDQDVTSILEQEQHTTDRPTAQSQQNNPYLRSTYSEENGRGVNTNRQAPSAGWMFRQPPGTYPANSPGQNPILTEPEGIATWRYLTGLKAVHGPMDGVMDIHGGVPFPADIMLPDGQFNPHKEALLLEMAQRVKEKMDNSFGSFLGLGGIWPQLIKPVADQLGQVQQSPLGTYDWTLIGQVWDTINYTVTGAYGFWMAQDTGLGGVGTNYENNCHPGAQSDWLPGVMQFFVDSARAAMYTTFVQSIAQKSETTVIDAKGRVGYVFNPTVLTDADNASPPPANFPNNPYFPHGFTQTPYRATSMKFLEDYSKYSTKPFIAVNPSDVQQGDVLKSLDTLVLVNHELPKDASGAEVDSRAYFDSLKAYVVNGGNLVVTDGAAYALADMGLFSRDAVHPGFSYVGYTDIQDHNDPLVKGLPSAARQTFDPITVGYQLRIERDGHWAGQPESGTANMAPEWTIDRATWEKLGGHTVATANPANDPKTTSAEGTATTQLSVGTLPLGKGRITYIGALLPDPTDKYPHWFGLGSYGVTFTGHHIFQQAITYSAPDRVPLSGVAGASAGGQNAATLTSPLPATRGGAPIYLAVIGLLMATAIAGSALAIRRRVTQEP